MSEKNTGFDLFANDYDRWFSENQALLESEVKLLAHVWPEPAPKRVLSVGCGTGLFEAVLRRDFGIEVTDGVEPAEPMAEIARGRGMTVAIGKAEDADFGEGVFDMLVFNGSSSYVQDIAGVYRKAFEALKPGGYLMVIDVPRESGFGVLYLLAAAYGTWEHPRMKDIAPKSPYPIPFVTSAHWHSVPELRGAMEGAGFEVVRVAQTLTTAPVYAHLAAEEPSEGADSGSYVALVGRKA